MTNARLQRRFIRVEARIILPAEPASSEYRVPRSFRARLPPRNAPRKKVTSGRTQLNPLAAEDLWNLDVPRDIEACDPIVRLQLSILRTR